MVFLSCSAISSPILGHVCNNSMCLCVSVWATGCKQKNSRVHGCLMCVCVCVCVLGGGGGNWPGI